MIPDGNESLGPIFFFLKVVSHFCGWRYQMTSSIYQYSLITYDVIQVGAPTQNLSWNCLAKTQFFGIFFEGIGSETKKSWPRVLHMTTSLFPSSTQILKIAVNKKFWLILMILDGNESWWPKIYEKYLCILMRVCNVIKRRHRYIEIR